MQQRLNATSTHLHSYDQWGLPIPDLVTAQELEAKWHSPALIINYYKLSIMLLNSVVYVFNDKAKATELIAEAVRHHSGSNWTPTTSQYLLFNQQYGWTPSSLTRVRPWYLSLQLGKFVDSECESQGIQRQPDGIDDVANVKGSTDSSVGGATRAGDTNIRQELSQCDLPVAILTGDMYVAKIWGGENATARYTPHPPSRGVGDPRREEDGLFKMSRSCSTIVNSFGSMNST
ncbi:unnamed protein product [Cutaneotrichosporon oleaginosum]